MLYKIQSAITERRLSHLPAKHLANLGFSLSSRAAFAKDLLFRSAIKNRFFNARRMTVA
jgi:hypothetical protein